MCFAMSDANRVVGLGPRFARADTAANREGQSEEEVRTAVAGTRCRTSDGVAGKTAIEVHQTQFTVVSGIKSLDVVVNAPARQT